jgi:hypothetical protein
MHKFFGKYAMAGEPMDKYPKIAYKQTLRKIERDVELVSFGINTREPATDFSNFVYVEDPDDIYKNIVTLFERLITDG